jgi:CRISPR-associated protein Csm3
MTIQFQGNLVITGQILCETGLHIGGVSEGIEIGGLENIVIRDPKTDLPFIPGSSLKGKMRSLLELSDKDATKNILYKYLFSWEEVPGNDSGRLIEFLMQNFNIGWIEAAKISKNDGGKTIRITNDTNFLSLALNNEKNNVNIEIDDGRTDKFIVKMEDGELNIYRHNNGKPCKCGMCTPCMIFGTPALDPKETMGDRQQGPTRIVVRDCHLTKDSIDELDKMNIINRTEVKPENTVDRITSEANPRTIERVPKGSVFSFEIVFSIYDDDDYTNFLGVFHSLRLLEDSYLGGSGTRGSGQVKFKDINIVKRSVDYYKVKDVEKTIESGKTIFDILDDKSLIDKLK